MENITTILRQAREHKGVSLKDVEGKTRIPLKYLQALEGGGENGLLADEMYLIPFLRSYANFLGVDANQAVSRFLTELQRQDSATVAPPERRPPMVSSRSGPSRLASWIVPFLLVLVALVVGPYMWQQGYMQALTSWWQTPAKEEELVRQSPVQTPPLSPAAIVTPGPQVAVVPSPSAAPESSPAASGTLSTGTPAAQDLPAVVPSVPAPPPSAVAVVPQPDALATGTPTAPSVVPSPVPPVVAAPPTTTTVLPAGGHRLTIQANSPTWMRVIVDSQPGKEMILKAGEAREWTAENGFTVSLGNAGGVTLNLDGQELPPVGKSGQVVKNMRLPIGQ